MEELLEPYVFYPVTVAIAVIYYVAKAPKELLRHWWKSLALGLLLILALSTIGSLFGYGAPQLLTFRAKSAAASGLRIGTAFGYILLFVGCGLLLRSLIHSQRRTERR